MISDEKKRNPDLERVLNAFADALASSITLVDEVISEHLSGIREVDPYELVPHMLLREGVQVVDAISILVRESSVEPCKPLLRTLLEIELQLEYLLEDTTKRSKAFWVAKLHQDINLLKRLDPSTQQGKEWRKHYRNDVLLRHNSVRDHNTGDMIANIEAELTTAPLSKTNAEYLRSKKDKRRNWYSLHDGPRSIRDLAQSLSLLGTYETLYRLLSVATHASDPFSYGARSHPGKIGISKLRHPRDAGFIFRQTMSLISRMIMFFTKELAPGKTEAYARWWANNRTLIVSSAELQIVEGGA